jgi:hypothetical protein
MAGNKQPNDNPGLENLSVNSSRRSGVQEHGTGNPAHQNQKPDPAESGHGAGSANPGRAVAWA